MIDAIRVRVQQHAAFFLKKLADPVAWVAHVPFDERDPCTGRCRRASRGAQDYGRPGAWRAFGRGHDGWIESRSDPAGRSSLRQRCASSTEGRTGAWANVKPMPNRKHALAFSPFLYRYRNLFERLFKNFQHFCTVVPRYEKDPNKFLGSVKLAASRSSCRLYEFAT